MGKRLTKLGALWKLLKLTALKWEDDNIAWMSAALAFYTLFSLAPTFILVVALGGVFFGEEAVMDRVVFVLNEIVGYDSTRVIQKMIETGLRLGQFSIGNVIGIIILLFAATNVFFHLKNTLNQIWGVALAHRHWFVSILINRFFSVLMVFSTGILLFLLVILEIGLAIFNQQFIRTLPDDTQFYILQMVNLAASFLIVTALFAMVYRILPDTKVAWRDVWLGAALASFVFTLSKFLIALYLGNSQIISLFGAASSFVAILVWVYFSAQILLLGASFTHFFAYEYGSRKERVLPETEFTAEEKRVLEAQKKVLGK